VPIFKQPSQVSINESEFCLFRNYIAEHSGIVISREKTYLLETRLSKHMAQVGIETFGKFYDYIIADNSLQMMQKIVNAITTNETKWFRDNEPWTVLENDILPSLIEDISLGKRNKVRIWSAAASTGQEIYSTVMCVDNYLRKNNIHSVKLSDFEFFATDISSDVLDIAKKGRYDKISMSRGLSDFYIERYFKQKGTSWDIDEKIRTAVEFRAFNLQNPFTCFEKFDIIFCRYILIYFSDELKMEVIRKMHEALNNPGIVFTGTYALLDMFTDLYNSNSCGNITYYQKREMLK